MIMVLTRKFESRPKEVRAGRGSLKIDFFLANSLKIDEALEEGTL